MTKTILDYLHENGRMINALCGGRHTCGKCIVSLNSELPVTEQEKNLLSPQQIQSGCRLACMHEYTEGMKISTHSDRMDTEDSIEIKAANSSASRGIGLIVDLGTTSVAMKWISRSDGRVIHENAFMNPQRSYGADVISRIDAFRSHGKQLTESIRREILSAIDSFGMIPDLMILAGNTAMTHIFLGIDPSPLGVYPFDIPQKDFTKTDASVLFCRDDLHFDVITFPHIGPYVGGDITSGIYALDLDQNDQTVLFMDLGTNGELVLCAGGEITAASTAAGPVFEGGSIRCGGGSVPGAVTKVRFDPLQMETVGSLDPVCICGSGVISLSAELIRHHLVDSTGRMKKPQMVLAEGITFDQRDLANVQLAKAALMSGVSILLKDKNADQALIAGGFGKGIDPEDLKTLKILPASARAKAVGNTSLAGCYRLLMEEDYERVRAIADRAVSVDLASCEGFQERFIECLYF